MSGVEAVAWICTRETTKGGRVFDEPFIATNRAYVEAHPLHDWAPLYSQATVDTLRAQLEAAEAEWREKFEARTIDWSEASNALYVWRHRAKDAEARAEAAEAEVAEMRKRMHFLATDGCVEGFVNVTSDLYDLATDSAEEAGRDEPNDDDLIDGLCDLIDLARTKEQQA